MYYWPISAKLCYRGMHRIINLCVRKAMELFIGCLLNCRKILVFRRLYPVGIGRSLSLPHMLLLLAKTLFPRIMFCSCLSRWNWVSWVCWRGPSMISISFVQFCWQICPAYWRNWTRYQFQWWGNPRK